MAVRNIVLAGLALAALAGCAQEDQRLSFGPAYGLFYNDQGETVALAYGPANSDEVQLFLQCPKGSGRVLVSDVDRGRPSGVLQLVSEGRRASVAVRLDDGEGLEPGTMAGELKLDAPVLASFRRSGAIEVALGGRRYAIKASAGERAGIERFFRACGREQG